MDRLWFGAVPLVSTPLSTRMQAALDEDIVPDSAIHALVTMEEDGCERALIGGDTVGVAYEGEVVRNVRVVTTSHRMQDFTKFAGRVAVEAKMVLGYDLEPTKANRFMVQDWMYRRLHKVNVRTAHIAKILPIAVPLAFLRTRGELDVVEALESRDMRYRNEDSRRNPGSRRTWGAWIRRMLPWGRMPQPLLFTGKPL